MFAPTMRCGVIKVCGINNNAKRRGGRDVGFLQSRNCAAPLQICKKNCGQYSIFKLRSGCDIGYYALGCVYTKSTTHTHALTQVLYSLFQKRTSVSLSRRACTCPQVSKRFLLIHEKYPFCCIKNATIAEMLPN
jgi:hypothetical protein